MIETLEPPTTTRAASNGAGLAPRRVPPPGLAAWMRYQVPYAAKAYAYFPVTLTKRVLLHPRRAAEDLMVRRFWDRWGWLSASAQAGRGGRPLWIHMNSGGEVVMAQSLLNALEATGETCYLSSDSYDAQRLLRSRHGADRILFPPWDTTLPAARVVRRLRPRALVFVANAYFPTLLRAAKRQGVATILLNAVMSRNVTLENRYWERSLALGAAGLLDGVAAQSEEDADAFRRLGVPAGRVVVTGKLEGDLAYLQLSAAERDALRAELGLGGPHRVVLAGSTHPGELAMLCGAYRAIRRQVPEARLVLVPRWIHEAPAMASQAAAEGFTVVLRTALQSGAAAPGGASDIIVVDTFGELRTLYGIADVAVIGSSLVPINARRGGHNVLEPLAHGVPPLFGPHMNLWRRATDRLLAVWPGLEVDSDESLARRALEILAGHAPLARLREAGAQLIQQESGAVERTLTALREWTPHA